MMTVLSEQIEMMDAAAPLELRGTVAQVQGLALRVADLPAPIGSMVRITNRQNGYDDPILQSISPTLTRYTMDAEQFARRLTLAARQLTESGILPAHAIRLMPEFLPGETV